MRGKSVCISALLIILVAMVAAHLPVRTLAKDARGDRIVVRKSDHTMTLFSHGAALKTYRVALGRGDGSGKQREGDHNTPEGSYVIDSRKQHSRFYKALHVSYPNAQDKAVAARLGVPPGGDIMVHGIERRLGLLGRLHRLADWTDGCIAVTDAEMDELWDAVPTGTPIIIQH